MNEPHYEILETRRAYEETGYRAGKLDRLGTVYPSPGVLDEVLHLFLATELTRGEASPESGEHLETLVVTRAEAIAMVRDGRIRDGKTVAGIHLALGAGG